MAVAISGWVTGVLAIRGVEFSASFGSRDVRHAFVAEVAGRVSTLDDVSTSRILTSEPALEALTSRLLGARVHQAKSAARSPTCARPR